MCSKWFGQPHHHGIVDGCSSVVSLSGWLRIFVAVFSNAPCSWLFQCSGVSSVFSASHSQLHLLSKDTLPGLSGLLNLGEVFWVLQHFNFACLKNQHHVDDQGLLTVEPVGHLAFCWQLQKLLHAWMAEHGKLNPGQSIPWRALL